MTRKKDYGAEPCNHLSTNRRKAYRDGVLQFVSCALCGEILKTYQSGERIRRNSGNQKSDNNKRGT